MSETLTFLDAFVEALTAASAYNRQDLDPPAPLLWPDKDRQWEPLLPTLRKRLPVFTLGPYAPGEARGPSYWLRYIIARTIIHPSFPNGATPILYLPGYSRQEIRAGEDCPRPLQPLAELQYRGALWSQKNGRDWTIAAFLQSEDGGLGIEVASDSATRDALGRALLKLAAEPIEELHHAAPIRAPFLDSLNHPDDVKTILRWLDDPSGFRARASPEEWQSFVALCQARYGFHPELDGPITAARLLGEQQGAWARVWRRFREAPVSYAALPDRLRQARATLLISRVETTEPWPQENEAAEVELRRALLGLDGTHPQAARDMITALDVTHGARRGWVWATLGHSPLALALEHLATLARETARSLGGSSIVEIASSYATGGWKADLAVLDALGAVEATEDVTAVRTAIHAVYRSWLDDSAEAFQRAVARAEGTAGYAAMQPVVPDAGTCVLLVDGLRYDVAQRLKRQLESRGLECVAAIGLGALPGVTATAKPAVSPAAGLFTGKGCNGFEPVLSSSGVKASADVLRRALQTVNVDVLRGDDLGDPDESAWTEAGHIDAFGHDQGWRISHLLSGELRELEHRITALLKHGWQRVVVVTDHGWLLLPGGLPKADLPEHLTEVRKGRCARLKPGARTDQLVVPWHWDASVSIAVAPDIHCFEAGNEYEHGGLSPQECVVPILTVRSAAPRPEPVTIESVSWQRLRCAIKVTGVVPGSRVDVRTKAGDPGTSLVSQVKPLNADGTATLLIVDEDQEGAGAVVVVVGPDGVVCAQLGTIVGG